MAINKHKLCQSSTIIIIIFAFTILTANPEEISDKVPSRISVENPSLFEGFLRQLTFGLLEGH